MSSYLFNLLTTSEIFLMEEESRDMVDIHTVYRELRRRVNGIAFNLPMSILPKVMSSSQLRYRTELHLK